MFTKLVANIKHKIMEKATRFRTLPLEAFMENNPPQLFKCLLQIPNALVLPKHLIGPVKKENGYDEFTWDFSTAL